MSFKRSFLSVAAAVTVTASMIVPAFAASAEEIENSTVVSDENQSSTALSSVGEYSYSLSYDEELNLTFQAQETGTYVFRVNSDEHVFGFGYVEEDHVNYWVCGKEYRDIEVDMTAGTTYSFIVDGLNESNEEYAEEESEKWSVGDSDTLHMMVFRYADTGLSLDEYERGINCVVPAYNVLKMKLNVAETGEYFIGVSDGSIIKLEISTDDTTTSVAYYGSRIDEVEAGSYDVFVYPFNEVNTSGMDLEPFKEKTEAGAVFSAIPFTGTAGDVTFELDDDGNLSFSGTGEMEEMDSYPWNTFVKTMYIDNLKIDSGVKSIASSAFEGMRGISSVYLPETVEKIGDNAFAGSSLSYAKIENPECEIGENALPDELVVLACYRGSTADKYAAEHGIDVEYLDTEEFVAGDISGNGMIDLYDAIEICKYIMGMRTFTDDEMVVADYDGNGKVDLYDAIGIAKELLGNIK